MESQSTEEIPETQANEAPVPEVTATEVTETPDAVPESAPAPAPDTTPLKVTRKFSRKYVIAGLLVVLAFALGVFGTLLLTKSKQNNDQKSTNTQQATTNLSTTNTDKTPTTPVTDTITWLETPKKLALLPVFTDEWFKKTYLDGQKKEDVMSFYEVGSSADSQYIIAHVGDGMDQQILFMKKTGDSYTIYKQHSPEAFYSNTENGPKVYQGPTLIPSAKIDETSVVKDISAPQSLTINGQSYSVSQYGAIGVDFIDTASPTSTTNLQYAVVKQDANGTLFEATMKDDPVYKVSYFTLMSKDHRMHPYVIDGNVFQGGVPDITWSDGTKNTYKYASAVGGCGFANAIETGKQLTDGSLEAIGKAGDGKTVYTTKSTSDPLLTKHYNEYKDITQYANELAASDKNLTTAQFKQKDGFIVVKDDAGRWVVMARQEYFPQGGCAKPVVYLYPTTATLVNVSVGADVTKSEPNYPAGGWKAVLAQINGNLQYQGKAYDSLFWEGFGKGAYPIVTSGSFVKHAGVEQKIRADLAAQGLNQKEINDFWAFWSAKVPNKDYVRITWLSKTELQQLAPLYVTPKPDTTIRVFLDMEGADAPYALTSQSIVTPKRTGFTVVEWGGLARDGSVPKLR